MGHDEMIPSTPRHSERQIQRYLESLQDDVDPPHNVCDIATLCGEASRFFRGLVKANSYMALEDQSALPIRYRSLRRSSERLELWIDAYNVSDGGIDRLLDGCSSVRRTVTVLLIDICDLLISQLMPMTLVGLSTGKQKSLEDLCTPLQSILDKVVEEHSDSSSLGTCSEDEADTTDRLEFMCEALKEHTSGLMELDPLIRNAVLDLEIDQRATAEVWFPCQIFSEKVEKRFPLAAADLVKRLGEANLGRWLRCLDNRQRAEEGIVEEDNAQSEYRDSALGSSHATQSHAPSSGSFYAETVMSYRHDGERSARIPPLSTAAKAGVPFECQACGKMITARTNSSWKKHLMSDLRPWICLEACCTAGSVPFQNKVDWVSHLALEHGMQPSWCALKCSLCLEITGEGRHLVLKHLADHLEEMSLAALPSSQEIDDTDSRQSDAIETLSASADSLADGRLLNQAPSGALTPLDDRNLLHAQQQGLDWSQIHVNYFPNKSPDTCRKRHDKHRKICIKRDFQEICQPPTEIK
ncbi:hypothetical protein Micbo1qcDRAFT_220478 [Microdochium bolleyi]|uniref:Oxidoreductase acuF-like C2H2 type zinc-finger domain-containing protein n=1 Tax=Microdochium bolleyi TaxID=196109 RepID=A0A136J9L2_9PEZI|nr:hypothetical protein Micbo1qcDRAFT_220478 [Microdochium bolleyi]